MIEIDYLWVGEHTNTGDAITSRFTNPQTGEQVVIAIDGGFVETGERVVEHVKRYYGTTVIDLLVCTHPDEDHIRGLFTIVEELDVQRLLIHDPRDYGYTANDEVKADVVADLVAAATKRGTIIDKSFAGTQYFGGAVTILSPSQDFYKNQLALENGEETVVAKFARVLSSGAQVLRKALQSRTTDPGETLTDDHGGTSARNNSSIVLNVHDGTYRALFTGDAGVPGLTAAADSIDAWSLGIPALSFFDIPHHGSRHNLNPDILNRLLGPASTSEPRGSAYVSVGTEADEFPRPEIANAVTRRGYQVFATRGRNIWWHRGTPERSTYTSIDPVGWLDE